MLQMPKGSLIRVALIRTHFRCSTLTQVLRCLEVSFGGVVREVVDVEGAAVAMHYW